MKTLFRIFLTIFAISLPFENGIRFLFKLIKIFLQSMFVVMPQVIGTIWTEEIGDINESVADVLKQYD